MKEVDDLLLQSSSIEGPAKDLEDVLDRCQKANITLSKKKVSLTISENDHNIPFAGFLVGRDGYRPDQQKVEAISKMESPG